MCVCVFAYIGNQSDWIWLSSHHWGNLRHPKHFAKCWYNCYYDDNDNDYDDDNIGCLRAVNFCAGHSTPYLCFTWSCHLDFRYNADNAKTVMINPRKYSCNIFFILFQVHRTVRVERSDRAWLACLEYSHLSLSLSKDADRLSASCRTLSAETGQS